MLSKDLSIHTVSDINTGTANYFFLDTIIQYVLGWRLQGNWHPRNGSKGSIQAKNWHRWTPRTPVASDLSSEATLWAVGIWNPRIQGQFLFQTLPRVAQLRQTKLIKAKEHSMGKSSNLAQGLRLVDDTKEVRDFALATIEFKKEQKATWEVLILKVDSGCQVALKLLNSKNFSLS